MENVGAKNFKEKPENQQSDSDWLKKELEIGFERLRTIETGPTTEDQKGFLIGHLLELTAMLRCFLEKEDDEENRALINKVEEFIRSNKGALDELVKFLYPSSFFDDFKSEIEAYKNRLESGEQSHEEYDPVVPDQFDLLLHLHTLENIYKEIKELWPEAHHPIIEELQNTITNAGLVVANSREVFSSAPVKEKIRRYERRFNVKIL